MATVFQDRSAAGRDLARRLLGYRVQPNVVVLAIAGGGVPVAIEIARAIQAPLDVIVVGKLGMPGRDDVPIGAAALLHVSAADRGEEAGASGGHVVAASTLDHDIVDALGIGEDALGCMVAREHAELERRLVAYRGVRAPLAVEHACVVLVDDCIRRGTRMRAALAALRTQRPARIVIAVPVAPGDTLAQLRREADELVCLATPGSFCIADCYAECVPLWDEEVERVLAQRWSEQDCGAEASAAHDLSSVRATALKGAARISCERTVRLHTGSRLLEGTLTMPEPMRGLVVLAHGSASSRFNRKCRSVAEALNNCALATLAFDLLTREDERALPHTSTGGLDIALFVQRLHCVLQWALHEPELRELSVGVLGTGLGAAAALRCAGERGEQVAAIVSAGGRPDLAADALPQVRAPTLFIVGSLDTPCLSLCVQAAVRMRDAHRVEVISGARDVFAEPDTLREAAILARRWFARYLPQHIPAQRVHMTAAPRRA